MISVVVMRPRWWLELRLSSGLPVLHSTDEVVVDVAVQRRLVAVPTPAAAPVDGDVGIRVVAELGEAGGALAGPPVHHLAVPEVLEVEIEEADPITHIASEGPAP